VDVDGGLPFGQDAHFLIEALMQISTAAESVCKKARLNWLTSQGRAVRDFEGKSRPKIRETQRPRRSVPILIVDRSALSNAGLRHIFADSPYRVVAVCRTFAEAQAKAFSYKQCVLIIGLDPENREALHEIARTKAEHGRLSTIVLAETFDPSDLVAALSAGGDAYLVKSEITRDSLLKVIEVVLLGGVIVPKRVHTVATRLGWQPAESSPEGTPAIAVKHDLPSPQGQKEDAPKAYQELSNRERMIVLHLMRGASNKEIARELNIAETTVKVHIRRLLRKIQLRNRTQVAIWALDNKIGQ
jgi:two-component system nitrate/nitrite response regulator NarL